MDREGEFDALAIRGALIDLSRTLDSLGEGTQSQSELTPPHCRAAAEADTQALGIVYDLLSPLSVGLQPGEMFTRALDRLSRPLAIERAMLFVVDAGEGRLVARAAADSGRKTSGPSSWRRARGSWGGRAPSAACSNTRAGDAAAQNAFIERMRLREAIALPVRAGDDVAGVLLVGRHRPEAFSASDTLLLLAIADGIGQSLARQAEFDREAHRTRYLGPADRRAVL